MSGQIIAVLAVSSVFGFWFGSYAKKKHLWTKMNSNKSTSNHDSSNKHKSGKSHSVTYANKLHCVYSYEMLIAEICGKNTNIKYSYEWAELPH